MGVCSEKRSQLVQRVVIGDNVYMCVEVDCRRSCSAFFVHLYYSTRDDSIS